MATKRSSLHIADVELSVSKINRLLRPLRNKCAIIASATSRPSGSSVAPITYGSSSLPLLEARAPPPLNVLHDPKLVISHAHQESRSLDSLARQIYAVTNAYRNVVQAALPREFDARRRGLLALTDICAATVGQNIRGEVARYLATLEGEPDEAQETALVDELYESVPARFRSWTLIAHATSEIVDTCPNHPMLMLSLLGMALIHGLHTESKIFLRSFLTALFRSPRHDIPPPITHLMHPSYLVELCNEWTRIAPESCAGPFSYQSFAAVTLDVLAEHSSEAVWTCKSITRFVQLLRTQDFECFLTFLHGLIENLATRPKYKYSVDSHEKDHHPLLARLAKWTGVITTDFFSLVGGDVERSGVGDTHARQFYSIVEILASAHDAGLHLRTIDDDTGVRDPQGSLVCAATHCLVSPLLSNTSSSHRRALLALLHIVNEAPRSSTFDALAGRPLAHLRALAGALRAHDLGALECALWASAVDHSVSSLSSERTELRTALAEATARRRECIDMATAGKGRVDRAGMAPTQPTRSPPRKRARRATRSSLGSSQQRRWLPSPSPSSSSLSTSISVASTPSLSSAPSSSSSSSSVSSARSFWSPVPGAIVGTSEDEDEEEDEDITRGSRSRVVVRSSCANLKFVLADALRTRKDLKAERRRASLRSGRCRGRSASSERGCSSCGEDVASPDLPSEGDVLDMFAYDDPF